MQISITISEIQKLATNGKVFSRGKALAQNMHMLQLFYLDKEHGVLAKVKSSHSDALYTVQVLLSQRDRPKRISCNCHSARKYLGCCKHMVATLISSMSHKLENLPVWEGTLPEVPEDFTTARKPYVEKEDAENKNGDSASGETIQLPISSRSTQTQTPGSLQAVQATSIESNTATAQITDPLSKALASAPARLLQLRALEMRSLQQTTETPTMPKLSFELLLQLPKLTAENSLLSCQIHVEKDKIKKQYKVKQLEDFLSAVASGRLHFFGQALDFDPKQHHFDEAGEDFLAWLTEVRARAVERHAYEYLAKNRLFNGSQLQLNPERLYAFLKRFAKKADALRLKLSWSPNDIPVKAEILKEWPPLHFYWDKAPFTRFSLQSLCLRDETGEPVPVYSPQALEAKEESFGLRLLTRDAALLQYKKKIYFLEAKNDLTYLSRLLLSQLALSESQRLDFSPTHAPEFLTLLYPVLQPSARLQIAEDLSASVLCEDLKAYVWLDQEGKGIRLQLAFGYGPYLLNPHPLADNFCVLACEGPVDRSGEALLETGKGITPPLIIRDRVSESKFLDLLQSYKFILEALSRRRRSKLTDHAGAANVSASGYGASAYYLFGETALLDFLESGLADLKALGAELYLSRRFKQIPVRPLSPFKGRLKLNHSSRVLRIEPEDWPYSPEDMRQILAAYREKRGYARLKDGSFVRWSPGKEADSDADSDEIIDKSLELLDRFELWGAKAEEGAYVLPVYRAVPLASLLKESGACSLSASSEDSGSLQQMLRQLREPEDLSFQIPAELSSVLRQYQKAGFNWLSSLDYYGFGGILADDMGLGKTLQALSYIASIRSSQSAPVLTAAPTSLIYNWLAEAKKFLPKLRVLLLEGTKKQRLEQIEAIAEYDMVVCSYAVLRQDIKELRRYDFSAFIIDEAQYIKNPGTQTARAAKKIVARRRFALTGTPVENGLTELWSIFDFLMPSYLFTLRQFQERFEQPIVRDQDPRATERLKQLTAPFILRRLKKDVLKELPDKIESELLCDMTPTQDKLYYAYLSGAREELSQIRDESEFRKSQIQILTLLTRLRQLCCHPGLFLNDYNGGSGKFDALSELLESLLEGGHSSLIFSQFTALLSLLAEQLKSAGIPHFYLDGATPAKERPAMAERFNAGEVSVFLISLRAGGTGLNLVGADTVIHLDPWWNPAVEDQATDRAHRIGQDKVVQIFRFIARGSIEEKINELKEEKRRLISTVIQSNTDAFRCLSLEDLRQLLE